MISLFLKRIIFFILLVPLILKAADQPNPHDNLVTVGIVKISDSFYYQDLPNEKIRLIIERLEDHNENRWKQFAQFELDYGFQIKMYLGRTENIKLSGHPLDGAAHFKMVLDKVNRTQNQIWVAYITDDLKTPLDPLKSPLDESILYCMTVVTSPKALITSHMGINKTISGTKKNFRGKAVRLHSLAAKVMLSLNPQRRFMVNAPTWVMESIIADALPDGLYVGTREMLKELERIGDMTFNDYLDSPEGIKEKKLLERRKIETGSKEFLALLKKSFRLNFPYVERKDGKKELLLDFLNHHPSIISIAHKDSKMIIYDAPRSDKIFLTIAQDNYDIYQWMFTQPFQPAGETHYIAVDLQKLANT